MHNGGWAYSSSARILCLNCSYVDSDTCSSSSSSRTEMKHKTNFTVILFQMKSYKSILSAYKILFSYNYVCERVLPGRYQLQGCRDQAEAERLGPLLPHQGVRHQEGEVHTLLVVEQRNSKAYNSSKSISKAKL